MSNLSGNGDIYKELNEDFRSGLKKIYLQISAASSNTDALFQEASMQLQEVVKATESAAMNIMDIVEKLLLEAEHGSQILYELREKYPDVTQLQALSEINSNQAQNLTSVLTALSFQDITGQRLKKVAHALNAIEKSVVDLYLSSGLALQAADEHPETDVKSIKDAAHKAVEEFRDGQSQLKGPDTNGCTQAKIDDLLSQLGM